MGKNKGRQGAHRPETLRSSAATHDHGGKLAEKSDEDEWEDDESPAPPQKPAEPAPAPPKEEPKPAPSPPDPKAGAPKSPAQKPRPEDVPGKMRKFL